MDLQSVTEPSNVSPIATLRCTICGDTFNDIDILEKHIYQRHDFKQNHEDYCDFCKSFTKQDFSEHSLQCKKAFEEADQKLYEKDAMSFCEGVSKTYDQQLEKETKAEEFKSPIDDTFENEDKTKSKHSCAVCKKEFIHNLNLDTHIKVDHENIKEFKCNLCPKTFGAITGLKRHVNWVHSKREFQCDICNIKLSRRSQIKVHKAQVHEENKKHVCQECNKAFAVYKNLQIHIKVVHHKIREFVCDICKKTFSIGCNLKVHVQNVHKEVKDIFCDKCDSSFKSNLFLRYHVKRKHMKRESYKCETCAKTFLNKLDLSLHIKFSHLEKEVNCSFCEKSFTSIAGVRFHTELLHKNQVQCKICQKICPNNEILKNHQMSHQDQEVKCSLCEKEHKRHKNLQAHVKRIHGKFICSKCKEIFSENYQLKDHLKTHRNMINNVEISLIPHLPNQ